VVGCQPEGASAVAFHLHRARNGRRPLLACDPLLQAGRLLTPAAPQLRREGPPDRAQESGSLETFLIEVLVPSRNFAARADIVRA